MSREPDWNEMASAWQAQPAPAVDVEALRREATRRGRLLRWTVVSEVLLTALMVLLFAYVLATQAFNVVEQAMIGGLSVVLVLYQAYMVWLRRREWSEAGLDADALLALEMRRCDTVVHYWRFGMWTVLGLWVGMYLAWLWALLKPEAPLSADGLLGGVAANVVVIPLIGLYGVWRSHQARRRHARLQALRAELAGQVP